MKLKSVEVNGFRRFQALSINDIPPARLIVMAGPNGSGKSSLFDAFSVWQQSRHNGINWDANYHSRSAGGTWANQVKLTFYSEPVVNKAFYLRSAYRNDPEFELKSLQRLAEPTSQVRVRRMIDQDGAVSQNYQRLASDAFQDAFDREDAGHTLKQFRENAIGEIGRAIKRLFPELSLNTLGNPLVEGTFTFEKGSAKRFSYKNLSGGEKAAFDLLLDFLLKRRTFDDTVFGIDEPETHINTRLQGALLQELYEFIPSGSQLWLATHSIGMMRKAREIYVRNPGEVIFFDFEGRNYDELVDLKPSVPNRAFWERILRVALDDLADLVAPKELIICEGNPKEPVKGKNEAHDARCYEVIFLTDRPDVKFISGGSSKEVASDRLKFAEAFPTAVSGIKVRRLIDRDDHSPDDVADFSKVAVQVLSRRHLESYLYDDEVIAALYERHSRILDLPAAQVAIRKAMAGSVARGNAIDDVKSAAGEIYTFLKEHLQLTACGNDQMTFARNTLAPLIAPSMNVYKKLEADIFK